MAAVGAVVALALLLAGGSRDEGTLSAGPALTLAATPAARELRLRRPARPPARARDPHGPARLAQGARDAAPRPAGTASLALARRRRARLPRRLGRPRDVRALLPRHARPLEQPSAPPTRCRSTTRSTRARPSSPRATRRRSRATAGSRPACAPGPSCARSPTRRARAERRSRRPSSACPRTPCRTCTAGAATSPSSRRPSSRACCDRTGAVALAGAAIPPLGDAAHAPGAHDGQRRAARARRPDAPAAMPRSCVRRCLRTASIECSASPVPAALRGGRVITHPAAAAFQRPALGGARRRRGPQRARRALRACSCSARSRPSTPAGAVGLAPLAAWHGHGGARRPPARRLADPALRDRHLRSRPCSGPGSRSTIGACPSSRAPTSPRARARAGRSSCRSAARSCMRGSSPWPAASRPRRTRATAS